MPTDRKMSFAYPDDFALAWNAAVPEFAYAANSVSLMMPHVEPYVARSVRAARVHLTDAGLREQVDAYVRQELSHHAQHRRFNELVAARCRGTHTLELWMHRAFSYLGRRKRLGTHLAFAAGSEAFAYAAARWAAEHRRELLASADPTIAALFVWHLAEEVEHKTVAFDVFQAVDGSRCRLAWGLLQSFAVLASFTVLGTTLQLVRERRLLHPVAVARLVRWTITFLFELIPAMMVTLVPGHHPRDLVDPAYLVQWLREHDTAENPLH